jgi:hypothetical protein
MLDGRRPRNSNQRGRHGMTTQLRAAHDATTTTSRLAAHADPTPSGARLGGRIAAAGARIPRRRRASLMSAVAFRLWAAAGICLAADGATAAEAALSPACAAADRRLLTLIEEHGEAGDVAAETLAKAFFTVLEARKACHQGQVEAALELYESIPLRAITSPRP